MSTISALASAVVLLLSTATVTATTAAATPPSAATPASASMADPELENAPSTICYWVPRLPGCPRR